MANYISMIHKLNARKIPKAMPCERRFALLLLAISMLFASFYAFRRDVLYAKVYN